jgi:hypothetical protein
MIRSVPGTTIFSRSVGLDVEVVAAGDALGVGAGRAGHLLHHRLDLAGYIRRR